MESNDTLPILGIKNFQKGTQGVVQALTTFPPIDKTESLSSPETFNKRFSLLSQSIRHAFNAAGDIAIRDKRYLETFLTGYTNPIVTQTFKYDTPDKFKNIPSFNLNGMPLVFNEDRIMYNISSTARLNTTASFTWVFKDGILMNESLYDIINTAYGLKLFVKASEVTETTEISIVVNKKFNITRPTVGADTVTLSQNSRNTTMVVATKDLGTFYHLNYIKLVVRRNGKLFPVPEYKLVKQIDVTGTAIQVNVRDYPLLKGDELFVQNTVYFWQFNRDQTVNTSNWNRDIVLSEKIGELQYPIPYLQSSDFDVFYNGIKLIPDEHYGVIDSYTAEGFPILRLLFIPDNGSTESLRIYKNEAVAYNDISPIYEKNLNSQGILVREETGKYLPFMARLGNCFASGRYVPNSKLSVKHKNIMFVDPSVGLLKDFTYQTRVLYTLDIEEVILHCQSNLSEYDQVIDYIGKDNIIKKVLQLNPPRVESTNSKTLKEIFPKFLYDLSKTDIHTENLSTFVETSYSTDGLLLDANKGIEDLTELAIYFARGISIDTNDQTINDNVIDANR